MAEQISLDQKVLYEIAVKRDVRAVDALLNVGASVDGSDELMTRPLIAAAEGGWVGCIELLIARGADLEAALSNSMPIFDARMQRCVALSEGSRALHAAVVSEEPAAAAALIKAGADTNAVDSEGRTPLMAACLSPSMTKALLAEGVDATFSDREGYLALHMAAFSDACDVVSALYTAAPSTLNQLTEDGCTPLSVAAHNGHVSTTSFLLAQGASDEAVWPRWAVQSSLWGAVERGHEEVVRLLLKDGLRATGGGSLAILGAMCRAAERRNARILQALLAVEGERRERHWARQIAGNMPVLHYATMFADPASVHVCLAAGADENFVTGEGLSASDVVGIRMPPGVKNKRGREVAVRRVMKRAAACRARSLAWPQAPGLADADKSDAVGSSRRKKRVRLGVRVRPPKTDRVFTTHLARYAVK